MQPLTKDWQWEIRHRVPLIEFRTVSTHQVRRGNCWDNAVAESFFSNLKSEKIKKRIYQTRAEAKSEIFDYIEGFYNRVRRHKHLDQISPLKFESRHQTAL